MASRLVQLYLGTQFLLIVCALNLQAQAIDPLIVIPRPSVGLPRSVDFSPDGKSIAIASDSGLVGLWDPMTGELQKTLDTIPGYPTAYSARFNPAGDRIVAGTLDGRLVVWDVESRAILYTAQVYEADTIVFFVEFGDNGAKIFASGPPGTAKAYDAEDGKLLYIIGNSEYVAGMPTFVPNERAFFTTWNPISEPTFALYRPSAFLRKWSLDDGSLIREYETPIDPDNPASFLLISPDASHWYRVVEKIVPVAPPKLNYWLLEVTLDSFEYERTLRGIDSTKFMLSFDFSSDSKWLLCAGLGPVFIWDVETGTILYEFRILPGNEYVPEGSFSPDNSLVAAVSMENGVHIWRIPTSSVHPSPVAGDISLRIGLPHPNPVSGSVKIPLALSHTAEVKITLVDVAGREVRRIEEAQYTGGSHVLQYDLSHLPSGYYTWVIRSGEAVQTRSVQVVR